MLLMQTTLSHTLTNNDGDIILVVVIHLPQIICGTTNLSQFIIMSLWGHKPRFWRFESLHTLSTSKSLFYITVTVQKHVILFNVPIWQPNKSTKMIWWHCWWLLFAIGQSWFIVALLHCSSIVALHTAVSHVATDSCMKKRKGEGGGWYRSPWHCLSFVVAVCHLSIVVHHRQCGPASFVKKGKEGSHATHLNIAHPSLLFTMLPTVMWPLLLVWKKERGRVDMLLT